MIDLVIKGGTVVDGTGSDRFVADVAVQDGLVVEVRPGIDMEAAETIDATGRVVTPGFVDIHTHYDGQATWDELLEPSSQHGVTTLVMGNCGVGFAPVRPGREEWLIGLMEGVEDIPGTALAEGMTWGWETFPAYLDVLDGRRFALDVGTQVPHGSVRSYVMGDRGARNEPADEADIEAMARIVREGIEAGALGFSTSRTVTHKAMDGEPVPGTFATEAELFAIGRAAAAGGRSVFELAPAGIAGEDIDVPTTEVAWMRRLAEETGMPISFGLIQVQAAPNLWRELLELSAEAFTAGVPLTAQVAARPFGTLVGWAGHHAFVKRPTFVELAAQHRGPDLIAELAKPATRARILAEEDLPNDGSLFGLMNKLVQYALDNLFVLGSTPDYEPTPDRSVAAIAAARGTDPLDTLYGLMLDDDGTAMLFMPFFNYADGNHDPIYEMLGHPAAVSGLSDGGAHCQMVCDASYPTSLLTHWARDRSRGPRLSLEHVVRLQAHDTARLYGLSDRGVLAPGKRADINVIDFEGLQLHAPRVVHDLPAGGSRLVQDATGYAATIVAGTVTRREGHDTGARPGRLLRGAR
jgi:N-acyl-D-aspartate/D-glutamate deacylase